MDNEELPVMRVKAKSQEEIIEDLKVIESSELRKQEQATEPVQEDLTQSPFKNQSNHQEDLKNKLVKSKKNIYQEREKKQTK